MVAQHWAATLHHHRREVPAVQAQADALPDPGGRPGVSAHVAYGTCWRGWVLAMQGQGEAGLALLHQGLAAVVATGNELSRPLCLLLLAEALGTRPGRGGAAPAGRGAGGIEASGRGDLLAGAYRLQGELLLRQAVPDAAQAEACFQQALAIARRQQAKSWELRAAMSLSRLWQQQGKRAAGARVARADLRLVHRGL